MASELSMNGRKNIETIKKEFNEKFQYLTLSFFDTNGVEFDQDKTLSEIRKTKGDDISIIASLKISSLEKKFEEEIGVKVEVSFIRGGQIIHTVEQNSLTLNELNEWCAQNGCEIIGTKLNSKVSNQEHATSETMVTSNDDAALQRDLFNAFSQHFPDAEAKKIGEDNHLDIFIPSVYPKRGAHLYFNTAKDVIKVGYYCRDEEFVLKVLSNASNIESYANGIRILDNPAFSDTNSAVRAAKDFILDILNSIHKEVTNTRPKVETASAPKPEIKIDPKPIIKEEKEEHKQNDEEVDLLAGFNEVKKTPPPRAEETKAPIKKSIEVDKPDEEEEAEDEEITVPEDNEVVEVESAAIDEDEDAAAEEKSELSSLLSKIKSTSSASSEEEEEPLEPDTKEPEEEEESTEEVSETTEEPTESEEDSNDFSTLLSSLNKVDKEEPKIEKNDIEEEEEVEEEEVKPIIKSTPTVKKSVLSAFDITNEATIKKLCDRIKQERILPHLPYINTALEKENFDVDNHVANFFLSKVFISDQNMEGFLYVNMDGFHSNCIDKKVMQPIFSWSGVKDIRYTEEGSNAKIDLIADQGELTIREEGAHALKVLYHIYLYAWKEANDKFANESVIIWNVVEDMGIKLNSYPTQEEYLT